MDWLVNFWKHSSGAAKAVVVGLVMVPIVALVITLVVLLIPVDMGNERFIISNYWEVTDAPKEYLYNLQEIILNIIGQKMGDTETAYTDATVRDGSHNETEYGDVVNVKMIIDVPSIRQSFAIEFGYNKTAWRYDHPDVKVSCPYYTDVIYPESKCVAATPLEQVERYLPHYEYAGGVKYAVSLKKYNGESYLALEMQACGDAELLDAAVARTREWLAARYLDVDDHKIETRDTCYDVKY